MADKKADDYRKEHDEMLKRLQGMVECPQCGATFKKPEKGKERKCPYCKLSKYTDKGFIIEEAEGEDLGPF